MATRIEPLTLAAPRAGEVRVRILGSGVCHSDLHVRDGDWPRPVPVVMGHEGAGVIEAVGPGVTDRHVGQPVRGHRGRRGRRPDCGGCGGWSDRLR